MAPEIIIPIVFDSMVEVEVLELGESEICWCGYYIDAVDFCEARVV